MIRFKASIPLWACQVLWFAFIFASLGVFFLDTTYALFILGWFAAAELYGIASLREGDTLSEQFWKFTKGSQARIGLVMGMATFYFVTLLRLCYEYVYAPVPAEVSQHFHFAQGLAFLIPSFCWLSVHFWYRGKYG